MSDSDASDFDDDILSITAEPPGSGDSSFVIPSASDLAAERRRELSAEDQVLALQQQATAGASGTVGESSLAALAALTVPLNHEQAGSAPTGIALAIEFMKKLLPAVPDDVESDYLKALEGPKATLFKFSNAVVVALNKSTDPATWDSPDRMTITRILCGAVLSRTGFRSRRALHYILERCTDTELEELSTGGGGVALVDEVRNGGRGEKLAAMILKRELTTLADGTPDETDRQLTGEDIAALMLKCGKLPDKEKKLAVQLSGRALAVAGIHKAPLPPMPYNRSLEPDNLRVALATARAQLIFANGVSNNPE